MGGAIGGRPRDQVELLALLALLEELGPAAAALSSAVRAAPEPEIATTSGDDSF